MNRQLEISRLVWYNPSRRQEEKKMSGFITKIELEQNRDWVVETYGQDFYDACLTAEGETFLGMLVKCGKI